MQRELDLLRTRPSTSTSASHGTRQISSVEETGEAEVQLLGFVPNTSEPLLAPAYNMPQSSDAGVNSVEIDVADRAQKKSLDRSMDGVRVEGLKVDDCFQQ